MKIGILTMHRPHNFGSALQSYATLDVCRRLGMEAKIIDYVYPDKYHLDRCDGNQYHNSLVSFLRKIGLQGILKLLKKARCLIMLKDYLKIRDGERKFCQFLSSMNLTAEYHHDNIKSLKMDFDVVMTGSDQTWNPAYLFDDYTFLLDFVPDNVRKISYASSFGSADFPKAYRETYASQLKKFTAVSVREKSGSKIFAELTGAQCPVVLDPTLLLNMSEWCSLIQDRPPVQEKYILCYLLFYFNPLPLAYDIVDQVQRLTGYKVKMLCPNFWNYPKKKGYDYIFGAGPLEFLQLYRDASFVVAASFHGTAFAVNFQKDFFAVTSLETKSNIRVRDFLSDSGLADRGIPIGSPVKLTKEQLSIDYEKVNERLEAMRENSVSFLKGAVK